MLVVVEDGLVNTRWPDRDPPWRSTVLNDMRAGHAFQVVHIAGGGL